MTKTNYSGMPVMSLLLQAGGWLEVNRQLQYLEQLFVLSYRYSAALHGQPAEIPDNDALQACLSCRSPENLNLFGLLSEIKRLYDTLKAAVASMEQSDAFPDFASACTEVYDEAPLPAFLDKLYRRLFSLQPAKSYVWLRTDNYPVCYMTFPDMSTLQDFAENTHMTGYIYKSSGKVDTLTNQFVDDSDFPEETDTVRKNLLADALRLEHSSVIHYQDDLFCTSEGNTYQILSDMDMLSNLPKESILPLQKNPPMYAVRQS